MDAEQCNIMDARNPYQEFREVLDEDQAFALLKRRLFIDRGLDCEQYKENYLKRRIAVRLRARNCRNYLEYLRVLRVDPDECTQLLNQLTINVTQFFRDRDVYDKIRDNVIPKMLESKRSLKSKSLRVWCAGCASGEEPYSVAILFDHVLGREIDKWNVRILGSDIDERSLDVAREGVYPEKELLEDMDPDKYFERLETDNGIAYKVSEDMRRRVKFERLNLLELEGRRHYDMVMCRNVLIYFSRGVQARLVGILASSIMRDGYIVLGKSETLGIESAGFFKAVFPRERIYQRVPGRAGLGILKGVPGE
jgi:chemotaxis protein methyltransferase CheR